MLAQVAFGRRPTAGEETRLLKEQRRLRIHALDGCLEQLEVALERGVRKVPADLALRVATLVPAVSPGLPTTKAIEFVFRTQEATLRLDDPAASVQSIGNSSTADSVGTSGGVPLNGTRARLLTDRIKQSVADLSLLLLEAHDGCAWRALGYRSWDAYVRKEFGFSRSRSYEMLDHGRVVRALTTAAGLNDLPEVSAFAASQLKSRLGEAVDEIAARVASQKSEEQARNIVHEVVVRLRAEVKAASSDPGAQAVALHSNPQTSLAAAEAPRGLSALNMLYGAVVFLTGLSDPQEILDFVKDSDRVYLERLREAAGRLTEIADAWESTQVAQAPSRRSRCPEFRTVSSVMDSDAWSFGGSRAILSGVAITK